MWPSSTARSRQVMGSQIRTFEFSSAEASQLPSGATASLPSISVRHFKTARSDPGDRVPDLHRRIVPG
jgi:hypothetical protein